MANYFTDTSAARPAPGRAPFRASVVLGALAVATALLSGMGGEDAGRRFGGSAAPEALRFDHVQLSTGVRLHYAEQGDPAGEPVILLHGYSDSWFSWSRVLPLFPESWRVYALDQRGQGDSDRPATGYGMADIAADVIAFLDAKGIRRATVVGHSTGGLVAQQVARLAPGRVARLVLVATAGSIREINGVDEFGQVVMTLADPVPEAFVREFQLSTIHRPLPPEFVDRVVAESLKLPARVWHGIMQGMLDTPAPDLSRAIFPTLLLWGDHDAVFPRATQDGLQARIPGARLIVFPETGHAVHWERPEQFAEELRDFVAARGR
ncbi:MAG TPA: alpha/beta fold hydrolase [Gemmatimonadales bacterium]|nr:alpha/beta fold hydrolase [Gemmatimonadales bacterium]